MVADIGGTNARLALARDGTVLADSIRSYRNDDFDGFLALARQFLEEVDAIRMPEAVVAVAGPVWGENARLTNRDWSFDAAELADDLYLAKVVLINDLSALGHALPVLQPSQVLSIYGPDRPQYPPTQSLVVGIGTGFNVCPVLHSETSVQCLEAEFGHVSLLSSVAAAAGTGLESISDRFERVESLFSGRGYQAILQQSGTPELYAVLMAALARDLMLAFMPRSGLFFSGGVARSILTSSARADFIKTFTRPFDLAPNFTAPVSLIVDDGAALAGCARVVVSQKA